jgi:hypothetical protein
MPYDVAVIEDPAAAEASLDPIRARRLAELAEHHHRVGSRPEPTGQSRSSPGSRPYETLSIRRPSGPGSRERS